MNHFAVCCHTKCESVHEVIQMCANDCSSMNDRVSYERLNEPHDTAGFFLGVQKIMRLGVLH